MGVRATLECEYTQISNLFLGLNLKLSMHPTLFQMQPELSGRCG